MMDIGKDLQDAYEHGRQDALTELMEYTYGMLTAEKFGLQHKIKSMMSDCPFCKTEPSDSENPNNCETCRHYDPDHEAIACERCLDGKYSRYEPKDEPSADDLSAVDKDTNVRGKGCETCNFKSCDKCFMCSHYEPKDEPHHSGEVTETVKDMDQSCDNCYYEYFDSRAYPCSRCIHNKPETDMWTEKVAD